MVCNLGNYIIHISNTVAPTVHYDRGAVCGQYNLAVWVQASDKRNQALLPLNVQTDLRLIHKQNIRLLVLNQNRKQYDENAKTTAYFVNYTFPALIFFNVF